jgi:hypothetical protein
LRTRSVGSASNKVTGSRPSPGTIIGTSRFTTA